MPRYSIAAAALLFCVPATAAPLLSGNYALTENLTCQVDAKLDDGTGLLTLTKMGSNGFAVSTATFDSDTGTLTTTGIASAETAIFEKSSDGSHKGFHVKRYTTNLNVPYSNDDTTLTINGSVFDVVYTKVENGIADGFTAISEQKEPLSCVENLVAQTQ
jgi:hypothetical protein